MRLKHEEKMYPPRVKMTIMVRNQECFKLPVKIEGCSKEGHLDMDIAIGIKLLISLAPVMYGIYCTEVRGREAAQGLRSINAMHPKCV